MGSRRTGFNVWVGVRAWVAEGPAQKEWKRGMEVSSVYGDEMQFQFSRNTGFTDSNNYACNESRVRSLGREDPLEEGTATHFQYSGEFHGQRSLVGYSPQGFKVSDTTERLSLHFIADFGECSLC